MTLFFIFLKQDLFYNSKNSARFLQNILFFLISCTIFFILSQNQSNQGQSQFLATIIIWFSLLFSILFSNSDFLNEDYCDGTLEQIIISCENLEIYIIAKIIAAWIIFSLPILITIPLVMLLIGLEGAFVISFLQAAFFATIAINFICAFCGSLNIAGNKAGLIALLAMPLIIPILLIACGGLLDAALQNIEFYSSLKILCGICIFLGISLTFATAKIARIVCE